MLKSSKNSGSKGGMNPQGFQHLGLGFKSCGQDLVSWLASKGGRSQI